MILVRQSLDAVMQRCTLRIAPHHVVATTCMACRTGISRCSCIGRAVSLQHCNQASVQGAVFVTRALRLCTWAAICCALLRACGLQYALQVGLKGQDPILAGDLSESVKPDLCFWNLADGKVRGTC